MKKRRKLDHNVTAFPIEETLEKVPNDAKLEWLFMCCDGLPPARAKRLILLSRSPEVAFVDDWTAQLAIDALNLGEA